MKRSSLIISLFLLSFQGNSQNTILWKVSDTINQNTSYITDTFQ
ncbi:hypothetical protein [Bizionia sp. M204]|nr:hypothetical protein [Bizionia sp. M204]